MCDIWEGREGEEEGGEGKGGRQREGGERKRTHVYKHR